VRLSPNMSVNVDMARIQIFCQDYVDVINASMVAGMVGWIFDLVIGI